MKYKKISVLLKFIIIGTGLVGALVYIGYLPSHGQMIARIDAVMAPYYWPIQYFMWMTAVPCYIALIQLWRISNEIYKGQLFCLENSKALKSISILAICDALFFYIGNIVVSVMFTHGFPYMIMAVIVTFIGVLISGAFYIFSYIVSDGTDLKEKNNALLEV